MKHLILWLAIILCIFSDCYVSAYNDERFLPNDNLQQSSLTPVKQQDIDKIIHMHLPERKDSQEQHSSSGYLPAQEPKQNTIAEDNYITEVREENIEEYHESVIPTFPRQQEKNPKDSYLFKALKSFRHWSMITRNESPYVIESQEPTSDYNNYYDDTMYETSHPKAHSDKNDIVIILLTAALIIMFVIILVLMRTPRNQERSL